MEDTVKRPESSNPCDHEWEFVDESFDHEYGTEIVHYYVCKNCDKTREVEAGDEDYEDYRDNEK